jgi:hypothetical protein
VLGDVYSFGGSTYLAPVNIEEANRVPEHGILRCGFRLYEILEWSDSRKAWKVRSFSATMTERDLYDLTSGRHRAED